MSYIFWTQSGLWLFITHNMASNELETSIRQLERTIKPNESQIASFNTQLEYLQRTVDQIIKAAALAAEVDDQDVSTSVSTLD